MGQANQAQSPSISAKSSPPLPLPEPQPSTSQALSFTSLSLLPPSFPKKRFQNDERSTHTTSSAITIPGAKSDIPTDLPVNWKPAPARIHHHSDNITDYYLTGTNGWEGWHQKRLEDAERDVGRILEGKWPPGEKWGEGEVVRKDVDFGRGKERKGGEGRRKKVNRQKGSAVKAKMNKSIVVGEIDVEKLLGDLGLE